MRGAIVTLDAHYAYAPDLQLIVNAGADFIVGIKGNQGNLEAEIRNDFEQANAIQYDSTELKCYKTIDKGHGRIEIRHICVTQDLDWLLQKDTWNLKSLVEVRSERISNNKNEVGVLYYGSSREGTPQQFANWVREHWGIENRLHYVVDVVFEEDASLADTGYTAENMGLLRRIAMNIIKIVDPDRGMADARRNVGFEPNYLRGLLSRIFTRIC
jgi:predicted transposase YbfD/YdcC